MRKTECREIATRKGTKDLPEVSLAIERQSQKVISIAEILLESISARRCCAVVFPCQRNEEYAPCPLLPPRIPERLC
jgi:hypothetical protein